MVIQAQNRDSTLIREGRIRLGRHFKNWFPFDVGKLVEMHVVCVIYSR